MADLPHFAHPFVRGDDGHVRVVEQDTEDHIMACENVIIRYPLGYRIERPEFGWAWPEFHNAPFELSALEDALGRFEPRGRANARQYADAADAAVRRIQIDVEV
jgi:phage baseplate assembly protein W